MPQPTAAHATILSLPEEILSQILDCFDIEPPSISRNNQIPSIEDIHVLNSPLKSASSVCRTWRRIAFPQLFKCARVPLEDVLPVWLPRSETGRTTNKRRLCVQRIDWIRTVNLTGDLLLPLRAIEFFDFIQLYGLRSQLRNLTVFSQIDITIGIDGYPDDIEQRTGTLAAKESYMKIHKNLAIQSLWRHLLSHVDPETLLIFAPPITLGSLVLDCVIENTDAWAFKIQCQSLELRQNRTPPGSTSRLNGSGNHMDFEDGHILEPLRLEPVSNSINVKDVLRMRNWTDLRYHGGSCLPAYGTYHYFEKMPPCFLTYNPYLTSFLGPKLTHFSYKTVFAHVVHFRRIISLIVKLESLQSLSLQLAPAPDSHTLDDLELVGKGNLRLPDCWMEVERAYSEVIRSVLCKHPLPVLEKLTEFTSYDCRKGAMKEELEAAFNADAPHWVRTGEFTWTALEPDLTQDVEMTSSPVEV